MRIDIPRELWDELEGEFDLREDYSGRGMYGKTCVGITGNESDLLRFVARVATWNHNLEINDGLPEGLDIVDGLADAVRSDSMGRDAIYYFPGVTVDNGHDGDQDVDAADFADKLGAYAEVQHPHQ